MHICVLIVVPQRSGSHTTNSSNVNILIRYRSITGEIIDSIIDRDNPELKSRSILENSSRLFSNEKAGSLVLNLAVDSGFHFHAHFLTFPAFLISLFACKSVLCL